MARKGKNNPWVIPGLILMVIILGVSYGLFGRGNGIQISCEDQEIIGVKNIPPPMMSVMPPPLKCKVDLTIELDNQIICEVNKYEVRETHQIIPCNGLDEYRGDLGVMISAIFYDPEEKEIGKDLKQGEFLWN